MLTEKLITYAARRRNFSYLQFSPGSTLTALPAADSTPRLLYMHVPFCEELCPYCSFHRVIFQEGPAREYFDALRKEIIMYKSLGYSFNAVYVGGGTPTILVDELAETLNHAKEHFPIREISVETNPNHLTGQNMETLSKAGVNRLSVGVQSFDDELLRATERLHKYGSGQEIAARLRGAQGYFDTLNVDMIFNFPSQTIAQFEKDIEIFKSLNLDQATYYPLMPSPHKKTKLERKFSQVDTSREKQFYDIIVKEMFAAGYKASTAWCFSKGNRIIDEYIIDYDDYVGVGAGSVGFLNGNFYVNTFALGKYDSLIASGKLPLINWRHLSEREHLRYYMLTKLFGMSLNPHKFQARFGGNINTRLFWEMAFFRMGGLVQGQNPVQVTRKGMYTLCVMQKEFFAALNTLRERFIEEQR